MRTTILLVLTAIVSLFLEITFFSVPLLVVSVILLAVFIKMPFVYFLAFVFGLIFDSMTLQTPGSTSLFLLAVLFLIRQYERKFETRNVPFVFLISVIALIGYLLIFGSYLFFIQFFISLVFVLIFFLIFNRFVPILNNSR